VLKKENNYAFINSQNVHLGIKSLGWELDWQKFRIFLKEKYAVKEAYLFIGYVKGNEFSKLLVPNKKRCSGLFKRLTTTKNNFFVYIEECRDALEFRKNEKGSQGDKTQ